MKKTWENPLTYNKIYIIRSERQHTQGKLVLRMTAIAKQTVELLKMLPEQEIEAGETIFHDEIDWN